MTIVPRFESASSALIGFLNTLLVLGLYSSVKCFWYFVVVLGFIIIVLIIQALYVIYRTYQRPEIEDEVVVGIPLWRSLILSVPYVAMFFPCHYKCAIGHTLMALVHALLLMLIVLLLKFQLHVANEIMQVVTYVVAAVVASSAQPLFNYVFYWFKTNSIEVVDATDILDEDERKRQEEKEERARLRKQRKSSVFIASEWTEEPTERVFTMDDLYELSSNDEPLKPFGVVDDKPTLSANDFTVTEDHSATGDVFNLFDEMENDSWQPVFVKRTEAEMEKRLQLAISGVQGEERVEDVGADMDHVANNIQNAFELFEKLEAEGFGEEAPTEPLAALPTANLAIDFTEDPAAGAVFDLFDELDDRPARQLNVPEDIAYEPPRVIRQPPQLPTLPEPPRYLKYFVAMSPSKPLGSMHSDAASLSSVDMFPQEQHIAGQIKSFLDDVLEDLEDEDEQSRDERMEAALRMSEVEAEEEQERAFAAARDEMDELARQQDEKVRKAHETNNDAWISIHDGPIVLENIRTLQFKATLTLGAVALAMLIILYAVLSSGVNSTQICGDTSAVSLQWAIVIDVFVQVLTGVVTWLYRWMESSDLGVLWSELHPYDGQRRAEASSQ